LAVCVCVIGFTPRTTVGAPAAAPATPAQAAVQQLAIPLEEGVKCVEPWFGRTDDESFRFQAASQFLSDELNKRGVRSFETLSLGKPRLNLLRTESGEVFEYSVELESIGMAQGKRCFKGVVSITPSSRDYAAEKAKVDHLFGKTAGAAAADCRGDSTLCRWADESFGAYSAEVKAILSDPSVRIVENYEGEIHLMTPSAAVSVPRGATVRRDAIGGAKLLLGSGTVYYLPPCRFSVPRGGMSTISIFVPKGGSLPAENEVNTAFSSADTGFWPSVNVSLIQTEFSSGDLLHLRQYVVPSFPFSLAKSKEKLKARFVAMGSASVIVDGVERDECYVEALRHLSGRGVLLVIGKDRSEAYIWRH
jgi:hypothetical protein